jgi:transaldolase
MFVPPVGHPALFHRRALMPAVNTDRDVGDGGGQLAHPAPRAPRVFADSATRADVEPLLRAGIINGLTTNPTLLKRAGADSWTRAKEIMRELCALFRPHPVSLELTAVDAEGMIRQASELAALGDNAVIKVPMGGYRAADPTADPFTGLVVMRRLWERGIKVNTTLVFNTNQALWAANAGATYVSPFMGRLTDYARKHDQAGKPAGSSLEGANSSFVATGGPIEDMGARLIFEIATVFANYRITTELLAASIRNPAQLTECLVAGADIVTVPAAVLAGVADHPLTDEGVKSFGADAQTFGG